MNNSAIDGSAVLVISVIWGIIGLGLFIWYLWAMARLFPRIGLQAGHGWIPVFNQWKLLDRAGLPGWIVLLAFVGLGIVPFIMLIVAMHRIGQEYEAGTGYTVLSVFLPPLWATLLASHIDYTGQAAAAGALVTSPGYARVGGRMGGQGATEPQQHSPQQQQRQQQPWQTAAPAGSGIPAVPNLPTPPTPPTHPAPGATTAAPTTGGGHSELAGPLGGDTEAEYARLAAEGFQASPATRLGQAAPHAPFSWTDASRPEPEPEAPAAPTPPPVHPLAATPPPAVSPPASPPASPPVVSPPPPPQTSAYAPPSTSVPPAGPGPDAEPAPAVSMQPRSAAAKPTGITGRVSRLPADSAATGRPVTGPAAGTVDAAGSDDDLDRTIVVSRTSAPGWVLELPDGDELPLTPDCVVGRRPDTVGGAVPLVIPDPTRTLSKTHARLTRDGENWLVEDLGSTNGVVLIGEDGSEHELHPYAPARATERMCFGTLEVILRPGGDAA